MIPTLLVTILTEGTIASLYAIWQKKPLRPILLASILVNLITQSLLWVVLNLFYQHYLVTLFIAEFLIWMVEGVCLYVFVFRFNQLDFMESFALILAMNLASFVLGWFLP